MSEKNQPNLTNTWNLRMKILTRRKKQLETAEIVSQAISDWYLENDLPEPDWKIQKDPEWWTSYLASLKTDHS
jgi:hypothetical protein